MKVKNKNSGKNKEKSKSAINKKSKKKTTSKNRKNKSKKKRNKSNNEKNDNNNIIIKEQNEEKSIIKISNFNINFKNSSKIDINIKDKKNKISTDNNINKNKNKKILVDSRVGTPHLDMIKYIKNEIQKKEKMINNLSYYKGQYSCELKNIVEKLENILINFKESPEEKDRIKLLYLILNINKKNNDETINRNKSLKKEYNILLNKNSYTPNEIINEFRTKIDISKSENLEMINQINELKNKNIIKNNKLKSFLYNKKYSLDINNLINELNTLNNEKNEALTRLRNSKKVVNSCIIKFKNVIKKYEEYKKENAFTDSNLNKIDKDINILKQDLLGSENEEEIYNKIENNKMLVFKEISYPTPKKIKWNSNFQKFNSIKLKKKRVESAEQIIKLPQNISNDNKKSFCCLKKNMLNINILPKINLKKNSIINNINKRSILINSNSAKNIQKDLFKNEELNISNVNDIENRSINYLEIYNNKKEQYNSINKKLDYSIKEVESMYKRKISQIRENLNKNIEKFSNIQKKKDFIKNEINNLNKIIQTQQKDQKNNIIDNNNIEIEKINRENLIEEIKNKYKDEIPFLSHKEKTNKLIDTELEQDYYNL